VLTITGQEESGWVCDDGFGDMEGEALCTFMFGPNTYWSYSKWQIISFEIYNNFQLDDINCTGYEDIWTQCTWSILHNCWSAEGLFLDCGGERAPPVPPNTQYGRNSQAFGLTNGTTGILYMRYGWVCDDSFNVDSARIVCAEMGMGLSEENGWWITSTTAVPDSWNGYYGYNDFGMDNLVCSETAQGIDDCTWEITHNCIYLEGVYLDCRGPTNWRPGPISFGLTDGDKGLLYTTVLSETGQEETGWVCDNGFGDIEGEALCTFLFGPNSSWSYAGQQKVSWDIYNDFELDDVNCEGDWDIWEQCTWSTQHNCQPGEGLFLDCGGSRTPPVAPNTENGRNSQGFGLTNGTTGILYMRNGWVCDDEFNEDSARIVCSEMGMELSKEDAWWTTYTTAVPVSWNGYFGYNDFGMDDLRCPETAADIGNCTWVISHNCMYMEGLYLNCVGPQVSLRTSRSSMSEMEIGLIFTVGIVSGLICVFGFWWFIIKKGRLARQKHCQDYIIEDVNMVHLTEMTLPETNEEISNKRGVMESDIGDVAYENAAMGYQQAS